MGGGGAKIVFINIPNNPVYINILILQLKMIVSSINKLRHGIKITGIYNSSFKGASVFSKEKLSIIRITVTLCKKDLLVKVFMLLTSHRRCLRICCFELVLTFYAFLKKNAFCVFISLCFSLMLFCL